MKKKYTTTDTSTIHTNYDIHGFHPTYETERTPELNHSIGEQVPYCFNWKTVREISNGYEPTFILGYQPRTSEYTMGEPGIQPDLEGSEGTDECDWWEWGC